VSGFLRLEDSYVATASCECGAEHDRARDPGFVDAAAVDFQTTNPAVASYGAYAPAP